MNKQVIGFFTVVIVLGGAVLGWAVWRHTPTASTHSDGKLLVTASFYPLADFAQHVGGNLVSVVNLTPAGAEPHDFEPSPQDIVRLQNSRVFIYNGASLEAWANRVLPDLQSRGVVTVQASRGIQLLAGISEEDTTSVQPPVDPNQADPHVWMDPLLAIQEVENIKNGFIQADPAHAGQYQANAAGYENNLRQLDVAFRNGLSQCERQDIVTSHAAFGYLARQYHLTMVPIAGLSPDAEPSPQRLAQIADFARQHHVTYIFFESLVSPKLSDTIAHEVGAQTIAFNPLEGLTDTELQQGKNYLSVQRDNLNSLQVALGCH